MNVISISLRLEMHFVVETKISTCFIRLQQLVNDETLVVNVKFLENRGDSFQNVLRINKINNLNTSQY